MKSRKGFTLIELLAVIVILAVIALIVTPIVTGIIKQAKDSANLRSAEGYYNAVTNSLLSNILDSTNRINDGTYSISQLESMGVEISGAKPTDGQVVIMDGEVVSIELSFGGSPIVINNNGSASLLSSSKVYGLKWDGNDVYTRLNDAVNMTSCVGTDTEFCTSDFDNAEIYGDIKDVSVDGNEFVYIPKFYIKKVVTGDTWEWYISRDKKDDNYYLPACFYDETTDTELPYVLVGKYNASLDETGTKLVSRTNVVPLVRKTINQFRTYATNNNVDGKVGYQLFDIHALDAIQTLFYIEFGTLNSQSIMSGFSNGAYDASHTISSISGNDITLTTGGSSYVVGQMVSIGTTLGAQNVVTNMRVTAINGNTLTLDDVAGTNHISNIAVGNIVYSNSNITGQTDHIMAKSGSIVSNTNGKYSMTYRGIENLYSNIWQFIDGVNIDNDTSSIYVNKNSKTYTTDKIDGDYVKVGYSKLNTNGYVTKMGYDSSNPFINFPTAVGGSNSTKYGDYYYMNTTAGKRIVLLGGNWTYGASDGLSSFTLSNASSLYYLSVGSRLLKTAL